MAAAVGDQKPLNRPSAILARMETALVFLSSLAMALIMFIVMTDVVLRYVFDSPLV